MNLLHLAFLSLIQGLAELLPVSSSAHVIFAEKCLGLDPRSPEMTFLLVMLHTGTMFAVLAYFGKQWKKTLVEPGPARNAFVTQLLMATAVTGVIGLLLKKIIEKLWLEPGQDIEVLFGNFTLISVSLAVAGLIIVLAGLRKRSASIGVVSSSNPDVNTQVSLKVGAVQGLCLPFRGLSRSGVTISTALLCGVGRLQAEQFSFALAVVLTPVVMGREFLRLAKAHQSLSADLLVPGLLGMVLSFLAGLLALRWLSSWLEKGRWLYFGIYCLFAAAIVFFTAQARQW